MSEDPSLRVAVIEHGCFERMRRVRVLAHRMPEETFEPWDGDNVIDTTLDFSGIRMRNAARA